MHSIARSYVRSQWFIPSKTKMVAPWALRGNSELSLRLKKWKGCLFDLLLNPAVLLEVTEKQ